jgi:very-short-patch-repair endonuclease
VIVEIYGDHPHANPKKYKPNDIIKLPGQAYTASEKWEMDQFRKEKLEKEGYEVFVIWESDDLQSKKEQLESTLQRKTE